MSELHKSRVAAVRKMMARKGWDAVIVTGTDPHSSEYPADRWKQVEWLSGFTGEAGDVVITMDHAGLWTDTRYFIQAGEQLAGSDIVLHKLRVPDQVTIPQWLGQTFPDGAVVAVDGLCQPFSAIDALQPLTIEDAPDMLGSLWDDRPAMPQTPIVTLGEELVGESRESKIEWLREFLRDNSCDGILLTSLDEIAWVLNVRGEDIAYNPLVISYLLVTADRVCWYVMKDTLDDLDPDTVDSFEELSGEDISICSYSELIIGLMQLQESLERLFVDPSSLNWTVGSTIVDVFGEGCIVFGESPVRLRKSVKNETEIAGFRDAYLEDGVAMEKFLWWVETTVAAGGHLSEWDASLKLTSLRAEIPGYRGNSFENISAYGKNAALPHYSTPQQGSALLRPFGLYLVDSGGQYMFGTTDITRTVPLGPCTALEREDYTLVLKGMIGLATAIFPAGTPGCRIDDQARMPLWKAMRNFGHGTGHGTGFFLGVHEGPQDIRQNLNAQPLLPGMVTSDEPGIYREGLHGIRHENIILCRDLGENEFGRWCGFETLTCCHIDTAPIVRELMTAEELRWLNEYNEKVYQTLSPRLYPEIAGWLRVKTLPV